MHSAAILLLLLNCILTVKTSDSSNSSIILTEKEAEIYFKNFLELKSKEARAIRYPCQCLNGQCGCCSGNILQNFNINMRQKLCMNMTYDPDDFAVAMKVSFNDNVFYNNKFSGKNPPPACIPIPRISAIKFCVRLTNVYTIGRNVHACVVMEAQWNKETAFALNFDCIRVGADGVSVVRPEEGGGLPHPVNQETDDIEEYDELLENQVNKPSKPTKPAKPTKPDSSPAKPTTTTTTIPVAVVVNANKANKTKSDHF